MFIKTSISRCDREKFYKRYNVIDVIGGSNPTPILFRDKFPSKRLFQTTRPNNHRTTSTDDDGDVALSQKYRFCAIHPFPVSHIRFPTDSKRTSACTLEDSSHHFRDELPFSPPTTPQAQPQ